MSTRSYSSPRRAQGASATREAILSAALELFESRGYAATSMNDVAAHAEVSLNTIYVSVGKKPELLMGILQKGTEDDDIAATLDAVNEADSVEEVITLIGRGTRVVFERNAWALGALYDNAAASDEFAAAITASEDQYKARLQVAAARISHLRPGVPAHPSVDVLLFFFGFRPWRELRKLGWSWQEAESWLVEQAASALVPA